MAHSKLRRGFVKTTAQVIHIHGVGRLETNAREKRARDWVVKLGTVGDVTLMLCKEGRDCCDDTNGRNA